MSKEYAAVSPPVEDDKKLEISPSPTDDKALQPTSNKLLLDDDGNYAEPPTEEESKTLHRVAGKIPAIAYYICLVEFAERASYYGVKPLFANFVRGKMPVGGNGYGAPKKDTQDTAGALGLGSIVATAVSQSFSMLVYAIPVFFGWLADSKTGRYSIICWGIVVCGIAHVLMVAAGAKDLLATGKAIAPFMISVYVLAIGAAMFKPNISPILLDQMPVTSPVTKRLKSGEKVIVDPEATTERVMLWFYLLINIGAFTGVITTTTEKYIGWWISYFIPLLLYLPLLPMLWWLKSRLILHPPGGSDLSNVMRILAICLKRGGARKLFRGGFFEPAKPSNLALSDHPIQVPWDDDFVEDVRRAFQATSIFCFFPIQYINDNGLGEAANAQSTMLITNGVPNDVIGNFNSLVIILFNPILNYGLYPFLRRRKIHYGPVARMTTGLMISTIGGLGYTILNHYAYKRSPCGNMGTTCVDNAGNARVSDISVWWQAIPFSLGGLSELFINVPAYGIAYSRSPKNMRGLVSAINLFSTAIAYAIGLACSGIVKDPYLTWVFGAPTLIGAVATCVFYWMFREIDNEEYRLSRTDEREQDAPIKQEANGNDVELQQYKK